jgi:uncharacterized cupin superfamily protein
MVPEARLEKTEAGLVAESEGWFVMNAREARWIERPGRGHNLPLTGWSEHEAETLFPQLGMALVALDPGEPMAMYHRETDQEDFLILAGEALLVIEGQERTLRQWDFVHCPPDTDHAIIGAGEGRCVVLAAGAREHQTGDWGSYPVNEVARRHGISVDTQTPDADIAYARFGTSSPTRFQEGWLPEF